MTLAWIGCCFSKMVSSQISLESFLLSWLPCAGFLACRCRSTMWELNRLVKPGFLNPRCSFGNAGVCRCHTSTSVEITMVCELFLTAQHLGCSPPKNNLETRILQFLAGFLVDFLSQATQCWIEVNAAKTAVKHGEARLVRWGFAGGCCVNSFWSHRYLVPT